MRRTRPASQGVGSNYTIRASSRLITGSAGAPEVARLTGRTPTRHHLLRRNPHPSRYLLDPVIIRHTRDVELMRGSSHACGIEFAAGFQRYRRCGRANAVGEGSQLTIESAPDVWKHLIRSCIDNSRAPGRSQARETTKSSRGLSGKQVRPGLRCSARSPQYWSARWRPRRRQ